MTFHTISPKPGDKCYECGEPAFIVLVNDVNNTDDDLPLCEEHWNETINTLPD